LTACVPLGFSDEREEIARPDSDKFDLIFSEMESLHQQGIYLFIFGNALVLISFEDFWRNYSF